MGFNTFDFLIFFPAVVLVYWLLPGKGRWRNTFLLVASYYFYMNWEPAYALLIAFSSVTTWLCGVAMERFTARRTILVTCLAINLAILVLYKYLGFFGDIIEQSMQALGVAMHVPRFELLLPVGISFYTFQAVGYTIDVYRRTIPAERNLFDYALFVSFFPQLVAGPIERARNLLPQFHTVHRFDGDMLVAGLRLMIWGYFLKLCLADNVADYVYAVFTNLNHHTGTTILVGAVLFTFQIFGDFCGYSLIAIGAARCMGFTLMQNFRQPYLSGNVRDFWRRWHISLSSWFADYLYIPMGGNRCRPWRHRANLFVTFLVSGLWHGAALTYVVWGAYHGVLVVLHNIKSKVSWLNLPQNRAGAVASVVITFFFVVIGWVFFRADTLSDAFLAIRKIFTAPGSVYMGAGVPQMFLIAVVIAVVVVHELLAERRDRMPAPVAPQVAGGKMLSRAFVTDVFAYGVLLLMIMAMANFNSAQFIYFQF